MQHDYESWNKNLSGLLKISWIFSQIECIPKWRINAFLLIHVVLPKCEWVTTKPSASQHCLTISCRWYFFSVVFFSGMLDFLCRKSNKIDNSYEFGKKNCGSTDANFDRLMKWTLFSRFRFTTMEIVSQLKTNKILWTWSKICYTFQPFLCLNFHLHELAMHHIIATEFCCFYCCWFKSLLLFMNVYFPRREQKKRSERWRWRQRVRAKSRERWRQRTQMLLQLCSVEAVTIFWHK